MHCFSHETIFSNISSFFQQHLFFFFLGRFFTHRIDNILFQKEISFRRIDAIFPGDPICYFHLSVCQTQCHFPGGPVYFSLEHPIAFFSLTMVSEMFRQKLRGTQYLVFLGAFYCPLGLKVEAPSTKSKVLVQLL